MTADSSHMRLEVISGNAAGASITVEDELVIGRHAEGAGRLSDDEELSRQHARISRERTGDYAIEDLGSSNGTFVNGLQIQSPRLLSVGDSIEAGATTLVVREIVEPEPPALEPPAPGEGPDPAMLSAPTVFGRVPDPPAAQAEDERTSVPDPPSAAADERTSVPDPAAGQAADQDTGAASDVAQASPAPGEVPMPSLRLEVDFDAREARLSLGEGGETIRLVFEDGRWRSDGPAANAEG